MLKNSLPNFIFGRELSFLNHFIHIRLGKAIINRCSLFKSS
jgi:hypothetical protein